MHHHHYEKKAPTLSCVLLKESKSDENAKKPNARAVGGRQKKEGLKGERSTY